MHWAAIQCLKRIGKDEPGVLAAMFDRLSDGAEVLGPPQTLNELATQSFGDLKDRKRLIADLPPVNPNARPVWQFTSLLLNEMRPFKSEVQVKEIKEYLKPADKRSMYAQFYAALCLAEAGPAVNGALDDLLATLSDPKVTDHEIREQLCNAIGNCGPEASRGAKMLAELAILQMVEDRARSPGDPKRRANQQVRTAALKALGNLGQGAKDALPAPRSSPTPPMTRRRSTRPSRLWANLGPVAATAVPNMMELMLNARPAQKELILDTMKKIGPVNAYPPIIEFIPAFERHWRMGSGIFKDQIPKARGCVEAIITMGPEGLKPEQRSTLVKDLRALHALAAKKGQPELLERLNEAINRLETAKK